MSKPQGFGAFSDDIASEFVTELFGQRQFFYVHGPVRTCALGAAADAVGMLDPNLTMLDLITRWPLLAVEVPSPVAAKAPLYQQIVVLNDRARWTREQIADWVFTIEQQYVEHPEWIAAD